MQEIGKKRFKMANKRIAELGKKTRFTSENQPKNNGRKPKLYNIAASGYKVSKEDFIDTANYVMQLPKEEAMKLAEKADTPMWVVLIIRSLYKSASKEDMRQLLDLAKMMGFEAPTELKIQKDGDGMSRDDVIKELERLEKLHNKE